MILQESQLGTDYEIIGIDLPEDSLRHLSHLGVKVGSRVHLVAKTKTSAIVIARGTRLAFDTSITNRIDVREVDDEVEAIPLSELPVGSFAYVDGIYALNEMRRRLMDMGLTRHTKVYLRKVAPLGDPIEITLRGYELTLRKSEANLISVVPLEKGGDL